MKGTIAWVALVIGLTSIFSIIARDPVEQRAVSVAIPATSFIAQQ